MMQFLKNTLKFLLFIGIVCFVFYIILFLGRTPTKLIDLAFQKLFILVQNNVSQVVFRDFLIYGLFTGIGGFAVYVPNIMLLFLFSHLSFTTGLTAKAARFLDPFFRLFGLNGYSFPPLLLGFGCSVNALHSAKNISNKKNKILTMLIAPFMSCGAKFSVYFLLIMVVFDTSAAFWVLIGLYTIGISYSLVSALFFRFIFKIKKQDTVEPLPDSTLTIPDIRLLLKRTLQDGWIFCKKAGSVIIIASIIIWALTYWPGISQSTYDSIKAEAQQNNQSIPPKRTYDFHRSFAAFIGSITEPIFRPLGQDWKTSVAIASSVAGRGVIIPTLLIFYGIEFNPDHEQETLISALKIDDTFSNLSALTMMFFVLLSGGCLASIAMFYHDMKSWGLTALFVAYPIVSAWIVSVLFYQIGKLFLG